MSKPRSTLSTHCAAFLLAGSATLALPAWAWEPTRPVEFIVPAGMLGGADLMARKIQGIVFMHKLMKQPITVTNMSGSNGWEGYHSMKEIERNPNRIVITLSSLFTEPMTSGVPFNWKNLTPVAMLALDPFVLWVNAESPYRTASEYLAAAKAAGPMTFKMAGTGAKQEDQILTAALENTSGAKFIYVPMKSGADVARQLANKNVESSVNNPAEAVEQWRAGKLRPLCVFDDQRMPYKAKVTDTKSWNDIPTCKESGAGSLSYTMLRGIFMAPDVTPDEQAFYVELMKKVRATPEWKSYMEKGAFKQSFMVGADYVKWLDAAEKNHRQLLTAAGFLYR